jgi:hypothetical protein
MESVMIGELHGSVSNTVPDAHARQVRSPAWLRALSVVSLLIIAGIHLNLYAREEYKEIPTVGVLFLLTVISAVLVGIAVAVSSRPAIAAGAVLFALGVLGGYVLTLVLPNGLFSFKEPGVSYSGAASIALEGVVIVSSLMMLAKRLPHLPRRASTTTNN